MTKKEICPEVRRFILTSIPSVPHMEALMVMRAAAPASWTAQQLAQRLYVPPAVAAAVLADLYHAGMLGRGADALSYCFEAQAARLGEVIDQLAVFHASHLVEITILIHSKLDRKAQQFADAFQLRKEPNDG